MSFLNSIQNQSKKHDTPFAHWEYNDALTDGAIQEIITADIPDVSKHELNYDGTRAIDGGAAEFREGNASGGQAIKFRCFVTKKNDKRFQKFRNLFKELNITRNLGEELEIWNYQKLDETNRVANIIKQKIKL